MGVTVRMVVNEAAFAEPLATAPPGRLLDAVVVDCRPN